MKQAIIFLVLSIQVTYGISQIFITDSVKWNYETKELVESGAGYYRVELHQHKLNGDTTINGLQYYKLETLVRTIGIPLNMYWTRDTSYNTLPISYIRHDTINDKVYYREDVDSAEKILFDFTLSVGDTVPMHPKFMPMTIHSIDTINVFNEEVRKYQLAFAGDTAFFTENYIIEGIGGANGLIFSQPFFLSLSAPTYITELLCFEYQDSIYPAGLQCPEITIPTGIRTYMSEISIIITPNPVSSTSTISINTVNQYYGQLKFSVYDMRGQKVYSEVLPNILGYEATFLFERGNLDSGVYSYSIEGSGNPLGTGKIMLR